MNKKLFFILGVAVTVTVGLFLFQNRSEEPDAVRDLTGFIVTKNSIYAADQVPAQTVSIAVVRLEKPGFVVIHEDATGSPGRVLGVSNMLAAGETKNPPLIALSRATRDGELVYAMLHFDDGDEVFDIVKDKPAIDPVGGGPVMTIVTIGGDAAESGEISL